VGQGQQGAARADGTEAQEVLAALPEGQGRARRRRWTPGRRYGVRPPHLFVTEKGSRVMEGTLRRRLSLTQESRLKKADVKPHYLRRTFGT
jgi:site-specific recombinase XerC